MKLLEARVRASRGEQCHGNEARAGLKKKKIDARTRSENMPGRYRHGIRETSNYHRGKCASLAQKSVFPFGDCDYLLLLFRFRALAPVYDFSPASRRAKTN